MSFDFPASPTEGQMFAPPGGPLYVFNSPVWKVAGITTIPGEWVMVERFYTDPSTTWTKPANLAYLEVEGIGPGGGGGAAIVTGAGVFSVGGGGGAGGHGKKLFRASDLPASVTIGIGSAGTSSANGGTSTFGALLTLAGGTAGADSTAIANPQAQGGAGGGASGFDVNGVGAPGEKGYGGTILGNILVRGTGGSSAYGGGGNGIITATSSVGSNGVGYGSGGGGAANAASQAAAKNGGTGGAGFIRLREYYPAWVLDAAYAPGTIVETLYTAPSTTWNKPAGLKYLEVEGVGPGGGGGAAIGTAASQGSAGSGGGAGANGKKLFKASDLPASVTITIGSPGTNSLNGGTSTFGALLSLGGGLKGNNSAAAPNTATTGGLGGTASGFDINGAGAPGTAVYIITPGSVPVTMSGLGGSTPFGAGGLGWSSAGSSVAGNDAIGYGGGGGGAINNVSQGTSKAGGTGGTSFFKLREIY